MEKMTRVRFVTDFILIRWKHQSKFLEQRSVSSAFSPRDERKSTDKKLDLDVDWVVHRALRDIDRAHGGLCILSAVFLSRGDLEGIIELGMRHRARAHYSIW